MDALNGDLTDHNPRKITKAYKDLRKWKET